MISRNLVGDDLVLIIGILVGDEMSGVLLLSGLIRRLRSCGRYVSI